MCLPMDLNRRILLGRIAFCKNPKEFCHAGGYHDRMHGTLHDNYGLPCVGGILRTDGGEEYDSNGCVYCGKLQTGKD